MRTSARESKNRPEPPVCKVQGDGAELFFWGPHAGHLLPFGQFGGKHGKMEKWRSCALAAYCLLSGSPARLSSLLPVLHPTTNISTIIFATPYLKSGCRTCCSALRCLNRRCMLVHRYLHERPLGNLDGFMLKIRNPLPESFDCVTTVVYLQQ